VQITFRRCAERTKACLSRRLPPPFRVRIEQMLVTRAIIGDRMLKTVECRRPKFHTIQIVAQPL
jgi:hypothetical protein